MDKSGVKNFLASSPLLLVRRQVRLVHFFHFQLLFIKAFPLFQS
jgi:hypothetical protein